MPALNAAIEAAHAGGLGKGFALVAQEVRALSEAARRTGKDISHKAGIINNAFVDIGLTNARLSESDNASASKSQADVREVLERFTQCTPLLAETRTGQDGR